MSRRGRIRSSGGRALPWVALLCVCFAVALAGCRSAGRERVRIGWTERGEASWYGFPFHGQRTANGERYDMYLMTAAHRQLPLGTVVEVRNLANDRRVQVRVNDRGPFVRGRILDLSFAAATELDMVRTGTAEIELRVIEMGAVTLPEATVLTVQVGAFQDRRRADALLSRLADAFPEARIEESLPWYRVRIGTFADLDAAQEVRDRLLRKGFRSVVTRAGLGPLLSQDR
ncbi:MAG TPA: septal ring lytic transglycosylase RlpA family protein [Thermoanaerobaculia bacterium]|nr:septal ring lytic transglycosylase RlpA family protein [Thermoanaerobaculia bacterium]